MSLLHKSLSNKRNEDLLILILRAYVGTGYILLQPFRLSKIARANARTLDYIQRTEEIEIEIVNRTLQITLTI